MNKYKLGPHATRVPWTVQLITAGDIAGRPEGQETMTDMPGRKFMNLWFSY